MRPERIEELQKLLVQSYPEYFIFRESVWGGEIFCCRESFKEEAHFIVMAANKFEHLLEL